MLHQNCTLRSDDQSVLLIPTIDCMIPTNVLLCRMMVHDVTRIYVLLFDVQRCHCCIIILKMFSKETRESFVKAKTMILTTQQQRCWVGIITQQIPQWGLVNDHSGPSHAHSGNSTTPSRVTCHTPCADAFARSDWLTSMAEHFQRVVVYPSAQTF